jgi:glycine/D-amino acid oxidase-like deaminating enzyme
VKDRPYWWDTAPRPDLGPSPDLPARTDVAVIGGGYTGVAAARTLARAGVDVTVLERATLGAGASTRNGGFVLPGFKRGADALVRQLGAVAARELHDASRAAVRYVAEFAAAEAPDCDYHQSGHLILAAKPAHFTALARERLVLARAFQHGTELLPPDRLHKEELGTEAYYGALLDPLGGGVNPAQLFWALATSAQRAGARFVESVEVQHVRRASGVFMLRTSRGDLMARDVIVATNGYSGPAVPALRRRVVPVGSYLIATAPLGPNVARALLRRDRVVSDTRNLLSYFRIAADSRMLFGGRVAFGPVHGFDGAKRLSRTMCALFPRLLGTDIDYHWSGKVAMTMDQLPHAGVRDGLHYALGYNGHGVALATYLGARVGQALAGGDDLRPFAGRAFRAVPLHFGRTWFLPLVGAYYRIKDALR